ncbi:DUF2071 domain-containing protein [Flavobacterium cerinum]|uniref:DUF2071 domain-containing protein n=2 Tax=Flavobacterium cerinum TaxID=2502784 RepID=A0ABY5IZ43_9FLAO|nr:DUF2071 domain-containing protein [Flavobacterium cerinum]UUC47422.1 DUF2071 domain-containing protein [Flavobacterium cerinum]
MTAIEQLLSDTAHRTFDYPKSRWIYYQEWNNALFLHWKVPVTLLEKLVPEKLNIDTFDGHAYVSLVAFTMQKIRPRNLPAITFISDFDEINIRTYIDNDNKKGVYFLNIEAAKSLSAYIAKKLSGLPYEKSVINRSDTSYSSYNTQKAFALETEFEIKEPISSKTALDKWLTERYCLYLDQEKSLYRYDIHHKEWEIKNVHLKQLSLNYTIDNISLSNTPDFIHYSDGVKVVAWERSKI